MEKGNFDEKVENSIRNSNHKFIEENLISFLKIPSYTLNPKGIEKAKEYLINYISTISEEIEEFKGEINPLILAKVKGENETPLLIYMMYDTQPINNDARWISNPFAAEIHNLPAPLDKLGNCIISRGSYNSKSPLICFLNVIKILKDTKKLPVSLLLLFDGEEEVGSPSLLKILNNRKDLFKSCIDAYYPAAKQDIEGKAVLKLGYKGILSLNVKLVSKNKETHSAYSSFIPNPAVELIDLINLIYSKGKFNIPSLEKKYKLSNEEVRIIDALQNEIDLEKIKQKAGITQTLKEDIKQAFVDYLFDPTFNISTLKSGYLGEGSKNIVPKSADCNIDIRFAHHTSIVDIFKEIKNLVEIYAKNSKLEVSIKKNISYEGSRVNIDSNLIKSLIESFKKLEVEIEIWPLSAAAAPLSKIQKELGINFIVGGLGIGGYAHSPNEFIQVDSIIHMRLSYYYFLKIYSDLIDLQKNRSI
ncbi:MAG: M20/M25/M40 family metallo-hydrolase [Candidatus Hodarchaeota archaeon]